MRITQAKAVTGYRLELQFDNGDSVVVDLSSFAGLGVFAAWNSPGVFKRVEVTVEGAVEWPGQIDLCPDSLYMRMMDKRPEDVFPKLERPLKPRTAWQDRTTCLTH